MLKKNQPFKANWFKNNGIYEIKE